MKFLLRWLVTSIGVAAAVWLIPGLTTYGGTSDYMTIGVFALVLALINISVKPVLQVLSLPITVITLGLFYLVINALMLELAAWAAGGLFGSGLAIDGFGSAVLGSIVISLVSSFVNGLISDDNKKR